MKTCLECPQRETCQKPCLFLKKELKKVTVKKWGYLLLPSHSINNLDLEYSINDMNTVEMPTEAKLGIEEWKIIRECTLTKRQLRCIFLYYFRGFSTPRIGSMIGKSFTTVQRDIQTSLPVIKERLMERMKEKSEEG